MNLKRSVLCAVASCTFLALLTPGAGSTSAQAQGKSKIAFVSRRDGELQLYSVNPDGSGLARLTDIAPDSVYGETYGWATESEGAPAWSPAGSRITFTLLTSDDPGFYWRSNFYTLNVDGSGLTKVTNHLHELADWAAWSPDGSRLAFQVTHTDNTADIAVMNLTDCQVTYLTHDDDGDESPSWSPDGRRIVFASRAADLSSPSALYVINSDGSGRTRLTDDSTHASLPAWSPDGGLIAFRGSREGDYGSGIYVVKPDGSGLRWLTGGSMRYSRPTWSPDSTHIAFAEAASWEDNPDIYVIEADGSGLTNITNTKYAEYDPAWSPILGVRREAVSEIGSGGECGVGMRVDDQGRLVVDDRAPTPRPTSAAPLGTDGKGPSWRWMAVPAALLALVVALVGAQKVGAVALMRKWLSLRSAKGQEALLEDLIEVLDDEAMKDESEERNGKPPTIRFTSPASDAHVPPHGFTVAIEYAPGESPLDLGSLEISCDRDLGNGARKAGQDLADLFRKLQKSATWEVPLSLAVPGGRVLFMASVSDKVGNVGLAVCTFSVAERRLLGIDPHCRNIKTAPDPGPVQIQPGATLEIYGSRLRESPTDVILAGFPSADEDAGEEFVKLEFSGEERDRATVTLRRETDAKIVGGEVITHEKQPLPVVSGLVTLYDETRATPLPGQVQLKVIPQPHEVRLDYHHRTITVAGQGLDKSLRVVLINDKKRRFDNKGPAKWSRGTERALQLPLKSLKGVPVSAEIITEGGEARCDNISKPQPEIVSSCWHERGSYLRVSVTSPKGGCFGKNTTVSTHDSDVTVRDINLVNQCTVRFHVHDKQAKGDKVVMANQPLAGTREPPSRLSDPNLSVDEAIDQLVQLAASATTWEPPCGKIVTSDGKLVSSHWRVTGAVPEGPTGRLDILVRSREPPTYEEDPILGHPLKKYDEIYRPPAGYHTIRREIRCILGMPFYEYPPGVDVGQVRLVLRTSLTPELEEAAAVDLLRAYPRVRIRGFHSVAGWKDYVDNPEKPLWADYYLEVTPDTYSSVEIRGVEWTVEGGGPDVTFRPHQHDQSKIRMTTSKSHARRLKLEVKCKCQIRTPQCGEWVELEAVFHVGELMAGSLSQTASGLTSGSILG